MKNLFMAFFSVFLFVACSTDEKLEVLATSEKENYIKSNVSRVLSLEKSDIEAFKRVMKLNEAGSLISWDNELLEKVYSTTEDYTAVLTHIISELGDVPERIIVVDEDNTERVFYPSRTVENGNSSNSLRSGGYVRMLKGYVNRQDGGCTRMEGTCVVNINDAVSL